MQVTHDRLVQAAACWLRKKRCFPILTEFVGGGEIPDAIGWYHSTSYLIECKISRSDFLRDKKKQWRHVRSQWAIGDHRYYAAPKGMLTLQECLPWGLLEWNGRTLHEAIPWQRDKFPANKSVELQMMVSMLKRIRFYAPQTLKAAGLSYQRLQDKMWQELQTLKQHNENQIRSGSSM